MHDSGAAADRLLAHTRILVVEDGETARRMLVRGLREEGCEVLEAADGVAGLESACRDQPDLVLLDLLLPQLDGEHLLEKLRKTSDVPVIVTSVRASEDDRVEMLNLGADDYVVKPFAIRELLARIRAVLRRRTSAVTTTVTVGDLAVDFAGRSVRLEGEAVALTALEFDVLACLVRHRGRVISRAEVEAAVAHSRHDAGDAGADHEPGSNVVDVIVMRLRKKLGRDSIGTRRGQGFIVEDGDRESPAAD
jgi:DNA-binding response OmpR family regulator